MSSATRTAIAKARDGRAVVAFRGSEVSVMYADVPNTEIDKLVTEHDFSIGGPLRPEFANGRDGYAHVYKFDGERVDRPDPAPIRPAYVHGPDARTPMTAEQGKVHPAIRNFARETNADAVIPSSDKVELRYEDGNAAAAASPGQLWNVEHTSQTNAQIALGSGRIDFWRK